MKLIFISDTHTKEGYVDIPEGDIIFHCGDISTRGYSHEIRDFGEWFADLPHKYKVMIPGNHDFLFEREPEKARSIIEECGDIHLLIDQGIEIEGLKIWGSPITPWFWDWAFNRARNTLNGINQGDNIDNGIKKHWDLIPSEVDVLLTHGPPHGAGFLGTVLREREDVGCEDLAQAIRERKIGLNAFGHIHEGYGIVETEETIFVNCSILDIRYDPVNKPIQFEWREGKFSQSEESSER